MRSASVAQIPLPGDAESLLEIEDLRVQFHTSRGVVRAVEGVSYQVRAGEIVAVVGESGCGKSVTALAIMRLLSQPAGRITGGRIVFSGRDLRTLDEKSMRHIRGREIAMIFQEPMTSLNPVLTIGLQLMEPLTVHIGMDKAAARERAIELLGLVGIVDGERRLDQYPHHFSGGMRQRVMIAFALACNPRLLIADEPTTALDVTVQAQILALLRDLSQRLGIAMVIITHNLGIVARYADRVNVMYAGKIVEQGTASEVFARPSHPYTVGLLRSVPRLDRPRDIRLATIDGMPPNLLDPPTGCRFAPRCGLRIAACETDPPLEDVGGNHRAACFRSSEAATASSSASMAPRHAVSPLPTSIAPILQIAGLTKAFPTDSRDQEGRPLFVRAVTDVNFTVRAGETVGLVGESGCGKTTVGRMIVGLEKPSGGKILYNDHDLATVSAATMNEVGRSIQFIFQDPGGSLNPRMTTAQIIAEPLLVYRKVPSRKAARQRVEELLSQVGLYSYMADRYPHELSGGQRQRVGIARALALDPKLIVCDEPVSALDVSIQGQIINLLEDLQTKLGLTYLFIAHDLAVVRHISNRIVVMYLGRVMEIADRDSIYANPRHPYTRALLDAAPVPDPVIERRQRPSILKGELPSPIRPPSGCVFHTRCPLASAECREDVPALRELSTNHVAACIKA